MRHSARGALVAFLLVLVGVSAAKAQDYYFTNFRFGHVDYVLPDAPCLERAPATPWTFQGSAWLLYHCVDGSDVQRRFMHASDPQNTGYVPPYVPPSQPPTIVHPPNPLAGCSTVKPGEGWRCVAGGWLPPGM